MLGFIDIHIDGIIWLYGFGNWIEVKLTEDSQFKTVVLADLIINLKQVFG